MGNMAAPLPRIPRMKSFEASGLATVKSMRTLRELRDGG